MLSEERRLELNRLMEWSSCVDDTYYANMTMKEFEEFMRGSEREEFYKGYSAKLKLGYEEYRQEMAEEIAAITLPEELHYIMTNYNYGDGPFMVEEVMKNPACDIKTAKMVYWICGANNFYREYGSLENCPDSDARKKWAVALEQIEKRLREQGFAAGLVWDGKVKDCFPADLDFNTEPYCNIPKEFR